MSLRQAWKRSTIINKVGAVTGISALCVSGFSAIFSHQQAVAADKQVEQATHQTEIAQRTARDQRLLEWQRLRLEDDADMPNVDSCTAHMPDQDEDGSVDVFIKNNGNGRVVSGEFTDTVTGKGTSLMSISAGGNSTIGFPAGGFHRDHPYRITYTSPHGSTREETFTFPSDQHWTRSGAVIHRQFDFLVAEEPGRRDIVPENYHFDPPAPCNANMVFAPIRQARAKTGTTPRMKC